MPSRENRSERSLTALLDAGATGMISAYAIAAGTMQICIQKLAEDALV